ncbi:MAG TPA: PEP-CTERM sorting domain-containing protein [Verrucomicrobiae bacterium]|nr:PEP-CTERM sorting domain-containing protein [Verrucomicrobiae bacterium]
MLPWLGLALCSTGMLQAGVITQTLGASAGIANGSTVGTGTWNTAVSGHAAPFNGFIGSDGVGPNFSASWTFNYGAIAGTIVSATLDLGVYDLDSAATGNQVASYTESSNDLTSLLNAVSEALHGGAGAPSAEYDILSITLPASTFTSLALGNPTISLAFAAPGLGALGETSFNGGGIDFSTITITTQDAGSTPEPATWMLLVGGAAALAGRRWLRRA